uniref:Uncharacterized protein n=1 Tax=Panagrolaimus sp. PS1159 TaxID=55785 RepID=A0AC35FZV1_9BILA
MSNCNINFVPNSKDEDLLNIQPSFFSIDEQQESLFKRYLSSPEHVEPLQALDNSNKLCQNNSVQTPEDSICSNDGELSFAINFSQPVPATSNETNLSALSNDKNEKAKNRRKSNRESKAFERRYQKKVQEFYIKNKKLLERYMDEYKVSGDKDKVFEKYYNEYIHFPLKPRKQSVTRTIEKKKNVQCSTSSAKQIPAARVIANDSSESEIIFRKNIMQQHCGRLQRNSGLCFNMDSYRINHSSLMPVGAFDSDDHEAGLDAVTETNYNSSLEDLMMQTAMSNDIISQNFYKKNDENGEGIENLIVSFMQLFTEYFA